MVGGQLDPAQLLVGQRSFDAAWRTDDQLSGRNVGSGREQRACADDAAFADRYLVENRGTHADDGVASDGATVNGDGMPDGHAVADDGGKTTVGDMDAGVVLDGRFASDANVVNVPAQNGGKPDGRPRADLDITDEGCVVGQKNGLVELGGQAFEAAKDGHAKIRCVFRKLSQNEDGAWWKNATELHGSDEEGGTEGRERLLVSVLGGTLVARSLPSPVRETSRMVGRMARPRSTMGTVACALASSTKRA